MWVLGMLGLAVLKFFLLASGGCISGAVVNAHFHGTCMVVPSSPGSPPFPVCRQSGFRFCHMEPDFLFLTGFPPVVIRA